MTELHFQSRAAEGYDEAVGRITIRWCYICLGRLSLSQGYPFSILPAVLGLRLSALWNWYGPSGHVTCADISPAMLESAKARLGSCDTCRSFGG